MPPSGCLLGALAVPAGLGVRVRAEQGSGGDGLEVGDVGHGQREHRSSLAGQGSGRCSGASPQRVLGKGRGLRAEAHGEDDVGGDTAGCGDAHDLVGGARGAELGKGRREIAQLLRRLRVCREDDGLPGAARGGDADDQGVGLEGDSVAAIERKRGHIGEPSQKR